jgi:hypothetical protein
MARGRMGRVGRERREGNAGARERGGESLGLIRPSQEGRVFLFSFFFFFFFSLFLIPFLL